MTLYINDLEDGYSLIKDGKIVYTCRYILDIHMWERVNGNLAQSIEWSNSIEHIKTSTYVRYMLKDNDFYGKLMRQDDTFYHPNHKVLAWLNSLPLSKNVKRKDYPWAFDFKPQNNSSFSIFFLRKNDALNFVKQFGDINRLTICDKRESYV